jgi:hypothetical protein
LVQPQRAHALQVLRDAAFDSRVAAIYSRVCRRWRHLCESDDFYRKVELRAVAGRTLFAGDALQRLRALLMLPRYRSVCGVTADGVAISPPVLVVLRDVFPRLGSISFSGCTGLSAEPMIDVLRSLSCLRSLDFSSSSSASRGASPLAPKWIGCVMQAASALTSLDVQSCKEFTTQSLSLVAHHGAALTLLNISYTEAKIDSRAVFGKLVCSTPNMRAFYCCGLSLPQDAHGIESDMGRRWTQLQTISIGCQKPSVATHYFQASQVRVVRWRG